MVKVSKAGQAPGSMWLQSRKGGATEHHPSWSREGEQAWCDPGFGFFPAGPKPNTWRVLVRMACGHWFPTRGAHGCDLVFGIMLN